MISPLDTGLIHSCYALLQILATDTKETRYGHVLTLIIFWIWGVCRCFLFFCESDFGLVEVSEKKSVLDTEKGYYCTLLCNTSLPAPPFIAYNIAQYIFPTTPFTAIKYWQYQYLVKVRAKRYAIPMPLGPINQIAITTGPRPTHGGYPPPAIHQPANHPQINNSAYPRALKRGGRRRRTPPTTTTITGNTSTRTQPIKSGQLTLLNPSPRHQNYTTPPHHRGLPPGAATPPTPPYPWFPQQRWS